ncbi:MAG: hypothetical protein Aurels2KO_40000 [Aureliella sp.]
MYKPAPVQQAKRERFASFFGLIVDLAKWGHNTTAQRHSFYDSGCPFEMRKLAQDHSANRAADGRILPPGSRRPRLTSLQLTLGWHLAPDALLGAFLEIITANG